MTTVKSLQETASTAPDAGARINSVLDQYLRASSEATATEPPRSIAKLAAVAFIAALGAAEPRRLGSEASTDIGTVKAHIAQLQSSTEQAATRLKLRERLAAVLSNALHEQFQEGMTSEFARDLRSMILDFGTGVIPELQRLIIAHGINPGVGFEALTALATFPYSSIAADRLRLIEWALRSASPEIRYGAALGLATLRDKAAIAPLREAVKRERIPDLRTSFERVLKALAE